MALILRKELSPFKILCVIKKEKYENKEKFIIPNKGPKISEGNSKYNKLEYNLPNEVIEYKVNKRLKPAKENKKNM